MNCPVFNPRCGLTVYRIAPVALTTSTNWSINHWLGSGWAWYWLYCKRLLFILLRCLLYSLYVFRFSIYFYLFMNFISISLFLVSLSFYPFLVSMSILNHCIFTIMIFRSIDSHRFNLRVSNRQTDQAFGIFRRSWTFEFDLDIYFNWAKHINYQILIIGLTIYLCNKNKIITLPCFEFHQQNFDHYLRKHIIIIMTS